MNKLIAGLIAFFILSPKILLSSNFNINETFRFVMELLFVSLMWLWIICVNLMVNKERKNYRTEILITLCICSILIRMIMLSHGINSNIQFIATEWGWILIIVFYMISMLTLILPNVRKILSERSYWFLLLELLILPVAVLNWTEEFLKRKLYREMFLRASNTNVLDENL